MSTLFKQAAFLAFVALASAAHGEAKDLARRGPPETKPARTSQTGFKGQEEASRFQGRLALAQELADKEDFAGAYRATVLARQSPQYEGLSPARRHALLSLSGWLAMRSGNNDAAAALLAQAVELDDNNADLRYWLSQIEFIRGNHEQAAVHQAALVEQWPALLEDLEDTHTWRVIHALEPDVAARTRLLQALFDANWERKALGGASAAWYELALVRIVEGDTEAARAAVARVNNATELVRMRSDQRFDPYVDPSAPAFDVALAARREVTDLTAQAILDPGRMDILVALSAAMLANGQHEDVIALSDQVAESLAKATPDAAPFVDPDQQVWLLNYRAVALRRLGRGDEAAEQMRQASLMQESGSPNVSQALNLGQLLCSLDQPVQAREALARVGDAISPYGRMVAASVRQRAALRLGDVAEAAAALAYIRTHRADSETIYLDALVEAGELDDAATTLIGQLASPWDRAEMLLALQDFAEGVALPGNVEVDARWQQLVARPDVQAAVAAVGRIQRYGIFHLH